MGSGLFLVMMMMMMKKKKKKAICEDKKGAWGWGGYRCRFITRRERERER